MSTATDRVSRFLAQLFDPAVDPAELRAHLHPDATFVERPNAMSPAGTIRGLDAAFKGAAMGHAIMARQTYAVDDLRDAGDTVVVRALWTGTTSKDLPGLPAGTTLRAHIASFWELRDDRIWRVTTYDCYEPRS